ncbi:MAG: hypothetical protein EB079_07515 [Verrucomicrobia bacterium]|nr:hypothetical protein [Verrucomicrobiota bacterium]
MIFPNQPCRHNPDNPRVPAVARRHQPQSIGRFPDLGLRLLQDHRLQLLTLPVLQIQFPGQFGCFSRITAQQEVQPRRGLPHATPGVDSRAERLVFSECGPL